MYIFLAYETVYEIYTKPNGDASKSVDFNQKMYVYVDIGVQEYWVVDLQRKRIVRYLLEDPFYPEEFLYSDIKKVNVQAFPGLEIDLAGIFEDEFD